MAAMDAQLGAGEPMEHENPHASLAAHAMNNHPEPHETDQFLEALEATRLAHERSGRYEEADAHRQRAEALRKFEDDRRRQTHENQHREEVLNISEAHMHEMQDFEKSWDERHDEYERHAQNLMDVLAGRHQSELEVMIKKLEATVTPVSPKWSRDLLNLRKIQETLAKQKKYKEASEAQREASALEAKELALWEATRNAKIKKLMAQQEKKNELEMEGLRKRIASGREEQRHAMATEKNRLIQRYMNTKRQHESTHKIVKQRCERYSTLASGDHASTGVLETAVLRGPRPSSSNHSRGKPDSPGAQMYADTSGASAPVDALPSTDFDR